MVLLCIRGSCVSGCCRPYCVCSSATYCDNSDHQRERLVLLVTIDSQIIGLFSAATKVVFHACYYLLPAHVSELAVCLRERARSAPVQNGAMERV